MMLSFSNVSEFYFLFFIFYVIICKQEKNHGITAVLCKNLGHKAEISQLKCFTKINT